MKWTFNISKNDFISLRYISHRVYEDSEKNKNMFGWIDQKDSIVIPRNKPPNTLKDFKAMTIDILERTIR